MVVAGIDEGKNEICARVGYFNLGINLKTASPIPQQVRRAVIEVINNKIYQQSVETLQGEFAEYNPIELLDQYVEEALATVKRNRVPQKYALFEEAA